MAELHHASFKLTRGAEKLIEGGYIYGKQRRIGETTHWLCERRGLCRALIHTKGLEIIKRTNKHCHAPDEKYVSCCEVKVSIKRKAKESQDGSHHIIGECLETISEGTAAVLPKLDSLKRTIQTSASTLEKLILPEQYKRTCKDEQFLLYDSGPETQKILIFGTQRNLEMLQLSRVWLADCTFKTAPLLFTQLYVIHALRGGPDLMKDGHLLPSIFILLPNKTEVTYRRMWQQLQPLCPEADPTEILMNFEKAAINSFEHIWPGSIVKGCFFHLTQNIWRKVQAAGLQAAYSEDQELAIRIRIITALAFTAPHQVPSLFTKVAASCLLLNQMR